MDANETAPPPVDAKTNDLRSLLRIRPFRRLWLVLGLSSLGDWLGLIATAAFASQQFNDTAAQGLAFGAVIAVRLLPALVLGPIAGVLADRADRRYTMVICDLTRFTLFASIPTVGLLSDNGAVVVGWATVATFLIETAAMIWTPAKEASVPNLLPRSRLESANQLTLATTYGVTPVLAAVLLAVLSKIIGSFYTQAELLIEPNKGGDVATLVALFFNAFTFLLTALVVFFGIPEIGGRSAVRASKGSPTVLRQFADGWRYVAKTRLVRGLVLGILGAFAGGGVVIGTAKLYAFSLHGGDATFYVLFAMIFIGLGVGIAAGPRVIKALSRRRWFGMSIVLAGLSVLLLAVAWHLTMAIFGALLVGIGAGMAFLAGTTLLGAEVTDDMRGRVWAFVQTSIRVVLILAISLSGVIVGLGGSHRIHLGSLTIPVSTTRLLLTVAGVFGVLAGMTAFRQMDDKPGVAVLPDLFSSIRGRPLGVPESGELRGVFIVFEGGEGAGKSTQLQRLTDALAGRRDVVVTREPGATPIGARIRSLVLDPPAPGEVRVSPRSEALLYAADRAHHVASVVRPALARGAVVLSDRYIDSSLAYQGAGRSLPLNEISWLSTWATGGLKPDLVVLLDVDPQIGLARVGGRGLADRLEGESISFHERVRYAFLDLAAAEPSLYLVLDANRDADTLAEAIQERVLRLIPELDPKHPKEDATIDPQVPPPATETEGNGDNAVMDSSRPAPQGSR
jgi:dTMP kinase